MNTARNAAEIAVLLIDSPKAKNAVALLSLAVVRSPGGLFPRPAGP